MFRTPSMEGRSAERPNTNRQIANINELLPSMEGPLS